MGRLREQLNRIESNLAEHMRRTEVLEDMHAELHARVLPIEKHIAMWAGAGKTITFAIAVIAAVAALYKALQ